MSRDFSNCQIGAAETQQKLSKKYVRVCMHACMHERQDQSKVLA